MQVKKAKFVQSTFLVVCVGGGGARGRGGGEVVKIYEQTLFLSFASNECRLKSVSVFYTT